MWFQFLCASALCLVALFAPGFVALLSAGASFGASLACAPALCVAAYAVLAILFPALGVSASFRSLFCPALALALLISLVCLVARRRRLRLAADLRERAALSVGLPMLYAIVGVAVGTVFFVRNLDTAASFYQAFDNVHHLNSIRSFVDSGNYSSFNSAVYLESAGSLASPYLWSSSSFYPSAWHGLVSMVVQALDIPITVGINAVNAMLLCVVFPLGVYELLKALTRDKRLLFLGAFLSVAFTASVWDFVTFGPLYPMLLSYALMPSVSACFIRGIGRETSRPRALASLLVFVMGCIGVALAQPAGIFLLGAFLAPYCVHRAAEVAREGRGKAFGRAVGCVTALLIVAFWVSCYSLPQFRGTVEFNWPKTSSRFQGLVDVLLLSFTWHPVQLGLAVFVLVGFVRVAQSKELRWLDFSYAFVCITYIVNISTEGTLKHLLGGFWYTDAHRLAANVCIVALPLAIVGAQAVWDWLVRAFDALKEKCESPRRLTARQAAAGSFAVLIALVYCPSFEIRGVTSVDTSFGHYASMTASENDFETEHVLSTDELKFAQEVLSLIPEGSGIINEPNDGSGFLYSLLNANIYYRSFDLPALENEKEESVAVRQGLDKVAFDSSIQDAVRKTGAKYLLVLDQGRKPDETPHFWSYFPEQWKGIEDIDDSTPGFSVVLSRDDMRLYKIDAVN